MLHVNLDKNVIVILNSKENYESWSHGRSLSFESQFFDPNARRVVRITDENAFQISQYNVH